MSLEVQGQVDEVASAPQTHRAQVVQEHGPRELDREVAQGDGRPRGGLRLLSRRRGHRSGCEPAVTARLGEAALATPDGPTTVRFLRRRERRRSYRTMAVGDQLPVLFHASVLAIVAVVAVVVVALIVVLRQRFRPRVGASRPVARPVHTTRHGDLDLWHARQVALEARKGITAPKRRRSLNSADQLLSDLVVAVFLLILGEPAVCNASLPPTLPDVDVEGRRPVAGGMENLQLAGGLAAHGPLRLVVVAPPSLSHLDEGVLDGHCLRLRIHERLAWGSFWDRGPRAPGFGERSHHQRRRRAALRRLAESLRLLLMSVLACRQAALGEPNVAMGIDGLPVRTLLP
mmetsp:Transcript_64559/g.185626  ORF Transcript_64559/g.185626 Transcript_64559/m.185626 type:complete len:345 (-) Transcript_64559:233-1267(-)